MNFRIQLLILLISFLIPASVQAEALFLNNGTIIKGKIIKDTNHEVIVKSSGHEKGYPRSMIIRVLYDDSYDKKVYIFLKNKSVIEGYIVEENRNSYTYRTELVSLNERSVKKDDVRFISKEKFSPDELKNTAAQEQFGLGRWEFDFDPIGFLEFGPIVNLGVRLGPVTFIDLHFRYPYLGLLHWVLAGFDNPLCPEMGSAGVRINNVVTIKESPNAWYLGLIGEFMWASVDYYDDGSSTLQNKIYHTRETKGFIIAVNGGYRWRWKSGFYLNLGAALGLYYEYEARYTSGDWSDDPNGATFFGMLELGLGVEF